MESVECLVERAQNGDEYAFAELARRHYAMAHGIALSRTGDWSAAEEIAQDVFVHVWRNLRALRHQRAFSLWVRAIARNCAISWQRRKSNLRNGAGRTMNIVPEAIEMAEDECYAPDAIAARAECEEVLKFKAAALSPKLREALTLFYFEGFSIPESAEALGVSEDTFKKRLRLARDKMREAYQRQGTAFNLEQYLPYAPRRCVENILAGMAVMPVSGTSMVLPRPGGFSLAWRHIWHGGSVETLTKAGLFNHLVELAALFMLFPIAFGFGLARHILQATPAAIVESATYREEDRIGSEGTNLWLVLGGGQYGDYLLVLGVIPGSPADKCGLRPGDHIVRIAGKQVHEHWHNDLEMRMRGPVGSVLKLRVERPEENGESQFFDANIVREYIPIRYYREMWLNQ
jgi:RNA polymerase sigma factor (sigma-70 family)